MYIYFIVSEYGEYIGSDGYATEETALAHCKDGEYVHSVFITKSELCEML